jgi:2-methylcitrate dehydratase PrpD
MNIRVSVDQLSLTGQLARYWSEVRLEDIPPDVVATGKRFLLDTLAVGVRGAGSEVVEAVRRGVTNAFECERGSASLWGTNRTMPPGAAAMINGTATHAYEFDDYGGCGHPGAVVVPAICALAEKVGADGRRVLLALLAGYDISARVTEGSGGYRAHNERGWHSTGTCGTFGAAAGGASILGLDAERYAAALGIAGSFAGGIWAFLVDGAMTKRFHPGKASENGVTSALLAESGLVGPRFILEAAWGGFYKTYSGADAREEATVDNLGREFGIFRSGIKPYPCCRGLHSSVEALLDLMQAEKFKAADIDRIVVHGADRTVRQFSKRDVQTVLDAQFSMPYALAAIASSGKATLDEFCPPRMDDPDLLALMQRVEVVSDRKLGPTDEPDVEVYGRAGEVWQRHVPLPRGSMVRPLDDDFLARKNEAVATPVIGKERFERLRAAIGTLETVSDFREVTALLRPA